MSSKVWPLTSPSKVARHPLLDRQELPIDARARFLCSLVASPVLSCAVIYHTEYNRALRRYAVISAFQMPGEPSLPRSANSGIMVTADISYKRQALGVSDDRKSTHNIGGRCWRNLLSISEDVLVEA